MAKYANGYKATRNVKNSGKAASQLAKIIYSNLKEEIELTWGNAMKAAFVLLNTLAMHIKNEKTDASKVVFNNNEEFNAYVGTLTWDDIRPAVETFLRAKELPTAQTTATNLGVIVGRYLFTTHKSCPHSKQVANVLNNKTYWATEAVQYRKMIFAITNHLPFNINIASKDNPNDMEVRAVYFYKYAGVHPQWANLLRLITLDKNHIVCGTIENNGVVTYSTNVNTDVRNFIPMNFIGIIDNRAHILDVVPTETQAPTIAQATILEATQPQPVVETVQTTQPVIVETVQPTNEPQPVVETVQTTQPVIVESPQPNNEPQADEQPKQKVQLSDKIQDEVVRAVIEANNKRKLEAEREAMLAQQAREKAEAANKELIAQREQADKEAAAEIAAKIQATLQRTPAQQIEDLERDNMGQENLIVRAAGRQGFVEQCKAKIESNLQKIQALKGQIATA